MRCHTFNESTILVTEECCACGVLFAMPDSFRDQCLKKSSAAPGQTKKFYCPNGHSQYYTGTNEEQELRDQLERQRARAGRHAAERDQAAAAAKAQRGAATRARNERDRSKKRHAAGVCPCCERSFKQLRRHMASQHPEYDPSAEEVA